MTDLVTWAYLDNKNKADNHYSSKLPKHPDYQKIFSEWVEAKHKYNQLITRYESGDESVMPADYIEARDRFNMLDDAKTFMWAEHHGEDCTCKPDGVMICTYCKIKKSYQTWKESKNG